MGTTRRGPLRLAHVLAQRVHGGVAPSSPAPVSPGDDGVVNVDSTVVTVDFRRAARLRLPIEPPTYGAAVLTFARPRSEMLLHPSAAR
ncbi:hypothetical protein [Nocardioides jiangxiensis]|uniref:Uncharacterized protein n=1 Tax=Nocardioides jiangxiensis TaxID=3064524 RepID=A0ABT9AZK7_9ACTN|nr:hypothetical protein [Nocardioides sp. WY-20]MDO7868031.1 hypothetical protein [Nocardioides sp. WY-20]